MNNVNTLNDADTNQKKSRGLSRLSQVLALCTILTISNPTEVKSSNITDESLQNVEVGQNPNIINNIKIRTGVSLPNTYVQNLQNFVQNSRTLDDNGIKKFTEDFVVMQMQSNRGISKQNQLLFIWDAIYEQITGKNIYTGEDGNNGRLSEFENVMDVVEQCGKDYNIGFKAYVKKRTADARQQSAEARQQSIELTYKGLKQISDYYYLCKNNPDSVNENELSETKEYAKYVIQNCKKYGIDYKAKLSPEVRRFYDID